MNTPDAYVYCRNGVSPGNFNAIQNYSIASTRFTFLPNTAIDSPCLLYRLIVNIQDAGSGTPLDYGNISGGLSNGITVTIRDANDDVRLELTDGVPIRTNAQWREQCYDVEDQQLGGASTSIGARWTFRNAGKPLFLFQGESFNVELFDDLTGLTRHTFRISGYYPFHDDMALISHFSGFW